MYARSTAACRPASVVPPVNTSAQTSAMTSSFRSRRWNPSRATASQITSAGSVSSSIFLSSAPVIARTS